jgi:hypothetical protein
MRWLALVNLSLLIATPAAQAQEIQLSTAGPLTFANQRINTSSAAMSFQISNFDETGTDLTVFDVSIPGANSEHYGVSGFTSGVLASGQSETVDVTFSPISTGSKNATLVITSDDPINGAVPLSLEGTGTTALLVISPPSGNFGAVLVGSQSDTSFDLDNAGDATLTVSGLGISGLDPGAFALVTPPSTPIGIAPLGTEAITVRCAPTTVGNKSATFDVASDADNGSFQSATLSCTGVAPDLQVSDTGPIDFGTVAVGEASVVVVTVSNPGGSYSAQLTVTDITSTHTAFSASPTSFTVIPGASQDVALELAPEAPGPLLGETLTILSNDPSTPSLGIQVSGIGAAAVPTLSERGRLLLVALLAAACLVRPRRRLPTG